MYSASKQKVVFGLDAADNISYSQICKFVLHKVNAHYDIQSDVVKPDWIVLIEDEIS